MNISENDEDMYSFLPLTYSEIDNEFIIVITNQNLRFEGSSLIIALYGKESFINENREMVYQELLLKIVFFWYGVLSFSWLCAFLCLLLEKETR